MIEQNYNLDTIPFSSAVPVVHVSQYDSGSRTLKFKLLAGGSNYDMTGVTGAQINGRKPDGTEFSYNMTISNDVVSIVITEQMAAVAGRVMAEVVLTGANSSVLGTANFIIEVEESPIDEGVISDTDVPIIMDFVTGGTPGQIFKRTATGGKWVNDTGGTASDVTYDNTDSGLTATNVQDAIDETVDELTAGLSSAVKSVNTETPDANGNVDLDATDISTSSGVAIKSLTGNPLTISDALQGRALGVNASIEPIQDLHGYDHPWAGGAGKNLLNVTGTSISSSGVTVVYSSDGTITVTGTATSTASIYITASGTVPTGGAYIHVRNNAIVDGSLYLRYSDGERAPSLSSVNRIFDISDNAGKTIVGIGFAVNSGVTYNVTFQPSIETTADVTDWEPYSNICHISGISTLEIANGETTEVTVALGQTVYGGTLNVSTGELVVTYAIVDLGTAGTWSTSSFPKIASTAIYSAVKKPPTNNTIANIKCSRYKPDSRNNLDFTDFAISINTSGAIFLKDTLIPSSSQDVIQSYLSGTQLVYELETPLTFNLTPAQLNLLSSTNILTTNAEELTVRYYATGQQGNVEGNIAFLLGQTASNASAITALTASVASEETSPATATHATGTYLMYQNRLYKVIASIAVGETLTVGTNIQATTIMAELLALTA